MENVEAQHQEITQKLEKGWEALQVKEKERERLKTEMKLNLQKLRDGEREVIN